MEFEIKPLQIWDIGPGNPALRRIKILAKHPAKEGMWIYEEMPGAAFRIEIGRLSLFPEANLRYMHKEGMAVIHQSHANVCSS